MSAYRTSHQFTTCFLRFATAAVSTVLLGACATGLPIASRAPTGPIAPAALVPADSQRASFTWSATGVQIYECRFLDKGGFAWAFVAPQAELFDQNRQMVGLHGAGPFWAALDGSRTIGAVKARADGARPGDIPLLLLSAKSAGTAGKMAGVTSVQRLNTVGGTAPASGCETQLDAGKQVKPGYTADYVFFTAP